MMLSTTLRIKIVFTIGKSCKVFTVSRPFTCIITIEYGILFYYRMTFVSATMKLLNNLGTDWTRA